MFPRGLQLSQPFSRSRVRLPTARSLTTPSIAFSTSAIRCGGRRLKDKTSTAITNKNTDLAYKHARDAIRGPRSTHRKTSDKGSQKPESQFEQELGPVVISPPPGREEFEQQLGPVVLSPPSGREEFEQQEPRPIDRTARSSPENTTALPEIPELQAHPGTVRIIRHLAQDPLEKPRVRRVPFGVGEKEKHQLQARPAARPVNGRKEDFLGKRAVDSRSGSASAIKPAWATSPSENLQRKRRSAEARAANKDTETGLEEAFPSADELQAWFKEFTSERSNPEATTAQSAPLEPPKMRVKKTYEHDKLDTLVSSVNVAEKKAVEQSKEDGGPAIVVLNSVSRSLLESDFRHIAGHGQHVDGWTYGLVKVVQSRSRTTHEPQGCYFLFFDNELNARAYVDVLERLHNKSRQALPKEWRQKATGTPTPAQPAKKPEGSEGVEESVDELPDVDEQQEDGPGSLGRKWREDDGLDAARYTLLPPTAPLHCQIFTRDNIVEFENIREASKGLRPQQLLSKPKFARSGKASFVAPPPKGLVDYAEDPEIEHSRSSVLVYLVGTKMTVRGLRTAIEIDAEARNYPWQLLQEEEVPAAMTTRATKTETEKDERDPAIKPILSTLSTIKFSKFNEHRIEHELDEFSGGQMKEGEMHGFSRFVVSFADVSEARRFVRTWHKREMLDPRTERTVIVNVTSLW
ncbi:unnamed protein product [Sordaria macrospora k-hell]|uniref:WGS project CABT00000000 data, contig 2.2 n=1 Tax=Sordaria macrospora (strain ATCC MYA-333 / DSM 997 / K(L3346) / K-hell) TaxID=771870 RepID=F7VNL1_SORMK|nr:uncharacterized protein SMAC_00963 [Sordaria macrospora k-hell]CCC06940.1 unnamed protein product [Sordaria macrospora k-hell]